MRFFSQIYRLKMTHISKYNEEARDEMVLATPNPKALGRSVRDFYAGRDAAPTPRRFSTTATPMSRRIQYEPDLVAGLEEDENKKELKGRRYI